MKPSSSSPDRHEPTVRAMNFDRPLVPGVGGMAWIDPEIERLVHQAMERGRDAGRAQGYAAGWAQGRRAAAEAEAAESARRAELVAAERAAEAARIRAVLDQLAQAVLTLDRTVHPAWVQVADVLTDGAMAIARAVLDRELASVTPPVLDGVRTAVRLLADGGQPVALRMHPADAAEVAALVGELPEGVRIVADAEVPLGDVLALTPAQRLLVSLPQAIAAAEEVLRG